MTTFKRGVNQYQDFEVNEYGTIARHIPTGETVVVTQARYCTFNFTKFGTTINAHTLVAHAWLSDTFQKGLHVDHKYGKSNNHYTALQWVTRSQNQKNIAIRNKALGIERRKAGKMNYEIFIDILKASEEGLSQQQIVKHIESVHTQTFSSGYISTVLNKKVCSKYWGYLATDAVNNYLYK
ncbi:TPA: hypothetical protein JG946_003740 [Enterobacter hormaechei subsp. steigerwaltii]|nr:hypothetical protein [Enterobacter hormaechei subsp. steigerwaltii]